MGTLILMTVLVFLQKPADFVNECRSILDARDACYYQRSDPYAGNVVVDCDELGL